MPFKQNLLAPQSDDLAHSTHVSLLQMGVALFVQSLSIKQGTQVPSGSQYLPACEAQSALVAHSTQPAVVALQTGVEPEHWVSFVQPVTHTKRPGAQMGFATPQSPFDRHSTQALLAG